MQFHAGGMKLLDNILDDCGLSVQRYDPVMGGDINTAYCITAQEGKYFLKFNSNRHPSMFEKEARGLDLLRQNFSLVVPRVIRYGARFDHQYLLLEWIEKGELAENMWESFGSALALMHKEPQQFFGLNEDNYIGSLKQTNTRHNEWHSFYGECRIIPLAKMLLANGSFSVNDLSDAESFCRELRNMFPAEPAALLHGDLWSGNFMIHSSGHAIVFDPAVYFGHREMDIGMSKLFGGFDQRFYEAYNDTYPLEKGWEKRLPVTQLYPVLVHAVLFGGHYIESAKNILKAFS